MISGSDALFATLLTKQKEIIENAKKGMNKAAGQIMAESVEDTPVDTGDLRKRAYISKAEEDGLNIIANVGYEQPEANYKNNGYAVHVHEILENNHPIGKAKFLEDVVKGSGDMYLKALQREMKF